MARIRIKDIAEQAGVSPATVSRVLNHRQGTMREETRRRVEEVIARTGYKPSNAARSLRLDRSSSLGIILADIKNPFSSAMLEALSARASSHDLTLMTAVSGNDPVRESEAIQRLVAAGVDGLVVNTCGTDASQLVEVAQRVPCVLLDRDVPGSGLPLVTSNNTALVSGLVDELEHSGATRCYLITEPQDTSGIRRLRARAFTAEVERRGLTGAVMALGPSTQATADRLRALADETLEPIGLIAVNGLVLLRLIEALGAADLTIPADIRLATFDEYAWNRALFGGITTAVQDTDHLAAALLQQVAAVQVGAEGDVDAGDAAPAPRVEVPGHIVVRSSTPHVMCHVGTGSN